jgi:acyl-CoA synthetase (AMP-forming)/AMP-acid ligase II
MTAESITRYENRTCQDYESEKLMRQVEREPLPASASVLVREAAAKCGDKPLLVFFDDGDTITYREFDRLVTKFAGGLSRLGVGHGTHVGICVYTQRHYPITWQANARLGAVTVSINYNYTPRELLYMLEDSDARYLVIHKDFLPTFEAMERHPIPKERVIVVGGAPGYPHRWEDVQAAGGEDFKPAVEPTQHDLMNIQYTSGTTGMPKGAMQTQRYWLTFAKVGAAQFQNRVKNQLIAQPFYYVDGQWLFLMSIMNGATVYCAKKQSASRFFEWVKRYKINYCNFPEVVSKQPESPADRENELVVMSCYSHRPENYPWYEKRYGCKARQGFSMTELGCAIYVPMEADHMTGTATVGIPAAFREAMVADAEGRPVPRGELGELCVRGHGILLGYYKKTEATKNAFHPGGWFRTGDLARQDENGWFFYLGRMKDMVKRSGENVSATEVESVLRGVEGILEAAVLPVPDELRGEEVKAYLLLNEGLAAKDVPPERIYAHCEKNLAKFKIPRFLEYVTEFPRTPSLKIKKSSLIAAKGDLRAGAYDRDEKRWR